MRSVVHLTDAPPCPHCGGDAQALAVEDRYVDLYTGPDLFTVSTRDQRTYTIGPCGHVIAAFDCAADRILEWKP